MDRFFNMDNKFFTFMSRVADLIILNILCIVCCIPIVTIGPYISAMFYFVFFFSYFVIDNFYFIYC